MANLIQQLKEEQGLSFKEIAKLVGVCPATITTYNKHPSKVPVKIQKIISEKLGIEPPKVFECELEYVTVDEVAQRMGKSTKMVRNAIKQGKLPFAMAIQGEGEAHQYWILRGSFEKFISENKVTKTS